MKLLRAESREEIQGVLAARWPTLRLPGAGPRTIAGAFHVTSGDRFLAGFQVEVRMDEADSLGLPTVREVGGAIPWIADRHVNPDGTACLYLPEDLVLRWQTPRGIGDFLEGPVSAYFLGQAGAALGAPFPFGEWQHGERGLPQLLAELMPFAGPERWVGILSMAAGKAVKEVWSCPCGGGRTLGRCHLLQIRDIQRRYARPTLRFLVGRARELRLGGRQEGGVPSASGGG